jgi:hypothetical protein
MKTVIAVLLMLVSFGAGAFDEWTDADTIREYAYLSIHCLDWRQTLAIRNDPSLQESGIVASRIIGNSPSNSQVNSYMAGSALLQFAIASALPSDYRAVFQYISIGDAGASVVNNLGVNLHLPF